MYDLQTLKRLNDAAAVRETFPEHDCAEEVLYNPEYEDFRNSYVDLDEYQSVKDDRDALAQIIRQIVADQLDSVGLDFDRWWAQDLLEAVKVHTHA